MTERAGQGFTVPDIHSTFSGSLQTTQITKHDFDWADVLLLWHKQ